MSDCCGSGETTFDDVLPIVAGEADDLAGTRERRFKLQVFDIQPGFGERRIVPDQLLA